MNKLLVNIRYFIAPLLILVTLAGVLAGGAWVWTGVGLLGVGIILDTLINVQTRGAVDENGDTLGIPWLQNAVSRRARANPRLEPRVPGDNRGGTQSRA